MGNLPTLPQADRGVRAAHDAVPWGRGDSLYQAMRRRHVWATVLAGGLVVLVGAALAGTGVGSLADRTLSAAELPHAAFLPWVSTYRAPDRPVIMPITNPNAVRYTVAWGPASGAERYWLEESDDARFLVARRVYSGVGTRWESPRQGKAVGHYWYRVKAINRAGTSAWSAAVAANRRPLHEGFDVRSEGRTEVRGAERFDYGWIISHTVAVTPTTTAAVSVTVDFPVANPLDLQDASWIEIRDVETSAWSRNDNGSRRDPSIKWTYDWIIHPDATFRAGDIVRIYNQPFLVNQRAITPGGVCYWAFSNTTRFLAWQENDDQPLWKAYVDPAAAVLWYDDAKARLLLFEDVTYDYTYDGKPTGNTERSVGGITHTSEYPPTDCATRPVLGAPTLWPWTPRAAPDDSAALGSVSSAVRSGPLLGRHLAARSDR